MLETVTVGAMVLDKAGVVQHYNQIAANIVPSINLLCAAISQIQSLIPPEFYVEYTPFLQDGETLVLLRHEKESPSFYKEVLDHCCDQIFVCDGDTNTIYSNRMLDANFPLSRREVVHNHSALVGSGILNTSPVYTALESGAESTVEIQVSNGRTLLSTATPVYNEDHVLTYVVGVNRDITRLKREQIDLQTALGLLEKYEEQFSNAPQTHGVQEPFIFRSAAMLALMNKVDRVAAFDTTILLTGASGTGKSTLARRIYNNSQRAKERLVTVDCTAIPEQLFESELFGYVAGAFTGALKAGKEGLLAAAHMGTVFFDEISELTLAQQKKLLVFLQTRTFIPVGGTSACTVDVRIICATNKNLEVLVKEGLFREDLFYRINVVQLEVPPLINRRVDIQSLLGYFLQVFNKKYGLSHTLSDEAFSALCNYCWPGNTRELENIVESLAVTVMEQQIEVTHLPSALYAHALEPLPPPCDGQTLDGAVKSLERNLFLEAYRLHQNTYKLAKALGISQSKVMRLKKRYLQGGQGGMNECPLTIDQ